MKKFFMLLMTGALAIVLAVGCSSQESPSGGSLDQPTSETPAVDQPALPANGDIQEPADDTAVEGETTEEQGETTTN
ncbi:hypothetical protein [Ammoniphilus sp. CFH 90114]|uniref:hypothetical protein n=1 Tax=Ammoniphilus sp. CFH 90114 TaxID=2493665 RepID=UPI00100F1F04|nr:hypothetical protein [Ammoniphilus sp. CFH 90114]RXT06364.1 hypothetical protein EIZ39_14915 [Ammoniphilus sp. CFH 90114]